VHLYRVPQVEVAPEALYVVTPHSFEDIDDEEEVVPAASSSHTECGIPAQRQEILRRQTEGQGDPRYDMRGAVPSGEMTSPGEYLELFDYRRRVFTLYRKRNEALRNGEDPEAVLQRFRDERDRLFAEHPQSALDEEQRRDFRHLSYFPYNPDACVEATIDPYIEPHRLVVHTSADETTPMSRAAILRFSIEGRKAELSLYWIEVYGGGLFLPFWDATAPAETYGGGRYLFDTIKGSDFLMGPEEHGLQWHSSAHERSIQLDFNYAYNPSCAYNPRWVCPLAPAENRLPFPIRAGEKVFPPRQSLQL
jgi:uncharacterized protein (DUF1684 family)